MSKHFSYVSCTLLQTKLTLKQPRALEIPLKTPYCVSVQPNRPRINENRMSLTPKITRIELQVHQHPPIKEHKLLCTYIALIKLEIFSGCHTPSLLIINSKVFTPTILIRPNTPLVSLHILRHFI